MATIREQFFIDKAAGALWDVAVSIKRGNPLPLDSNSVFESYAALETYAAGVLAYPGQIVAVVEAAKTTIYYLDQELAIKPVGIIPTGDGKTVEVTAAGAISLFGSTNAPAGTLPILEEVSQEDGSKKLELVWKTLEDIGAGDGNDNTTYEFTKLEKGEEGKKECYGFSIQVKENGVASGDPIEVALDVYTKSEVDAAIKVVADKVGDAKDGDTAATGLFAEVDKKANAADVYTKTEIDGKVEALEGAIDGKANADNVYAKSEVYTKTEADNLLNAKANADNVYAKSEVYTKTEADTKIGEAVAAAAHLKREIVDALPSVEDADPNVIYMLPSGLTADDNKYYEWILLEVDGNKSFEKVGSWEVNLSDYVSETELEEFLKAYYTSEKVDEILEAYATIAYVSKELENYYTMEQINGFLEGYYTEEEIDALLVNIYTKTEIDTKLADYDTAAATAEKYYNKTEIDTEFAKYDTVTATAEKYYNKTEIDTTLANYYTETEADNKFVAQEEGKSLVLDTEIAKLATVKENAEENFIKSVDRHFSVSEAGELTLVDKSITIAEIADLQDALGSKVARQYFEVEAEDGSISTVEGTLLSPTDKKKLDALVIGEEGVEISGKVNADNVEELDEWINEKRDTVAGLYPTADATKLSGIQAGAQVNFITSVEVQELKVDDNKQLSIIAVPVKKLTGLGDEFVVEDDALKIVSVDATKISGLSDNYVGKLDFETVVGDISTLVHASGNEDSTIVDEINDINRRFTWSEMEE